jgi:rare lipoprotein A
VGIDRVGVISSSWEDKVVEGKGNYVLPSLRLFLIVLFVVSCAGPQVQEPTGGRQVGMASWYGPKFHGRRTANGEVFNMYQLTAAHRTLPLGSWVHVTNLENGRSIEVRVNDRGPFVRGRIIDLSYAAARAVGMVRQGVVRVQVLPLGTHPRLVARSERTFRGTRSGDVTRQAVYALQVGSFSDKRNAVTLKNRLNRVTSDIYISKVSVDGETFYRVRVGSFATREAATRAATQVAGRGFTVILIEPD